MNVDLKSIRPEFYRDYVKGDLPAVMSTIREAARTCHLEVTNLLVPGRNDSDEEIEDLIKFVARQGRHVPLHFSRYFPRHRATEPNTPTDRLLRAAALARQKLDYVYLGNLNAGPDYRDTCCPGCGNLLVDRTGYTGRVLGIRDGRCDNCGRPADFVL
jgi:pyruvate formate lyase activating enzyme